MVEESFEGARYLVWHLFYLEPKVVLRFCDELRVNGLRQQAVAAALLAWLLRLLALLRVWPCWLGIMLGGLSWLLQREWHPTGTAHLPVVSVLFASTLLACFLLVLLLRASSFCLLDKGMGGG